MTALVRMPALVGSAARQLRSIVFTGECADRIARAAGAELRRLRLAAGFSQTQVAFACGSYREIVARIERGAHVPTLETCALLAAVCGGSLHDVLGAVDRALGLTAPRRARARAVGRGVVALN
jgi:DNA-binding XRE family transcriptional regulator